MAWTCSQVAFVALPSCNCWLNLSASACWARDSWAKAGEQINLGHQGPTYVEHVDFKTFQIFFLGSTFGTSVWKSCWQLLFKKIPHLKHFNAQLSIGYFCSEILIFWVSFWGLKANWKGSLWPIRNQLNPHCTETFGLETLWDLPMKSCLTSAYHSFTYFINRLSKKIFQFFLEEKPSRTRVLKGVAPEFSRN